MKWDAHICVDMQRLFAEHTPWHTPWMHRILPNALRLVEARPDATIFTRFIPPDRKEDTAGAWKAYYDKWSCMTLGELGAPIVGLLPELQSFVPPAKIVDKRVYSPWFTPDLIAILRACGARSVVVSGGETEVCVLATVVGAIDHGFEVILAIDALCSSSDQSHDAMLRIFKDRYSTQLRVERTADVLVS